MKFSLFKYLFFLIAIILTLLAIYILYKDDNNKTLAKEDNKVKINIDDEINIGIVDFDTTNPIFSKNRDIQYISKLIYEPLLNITKDFKIENKLAKEFQE